MNHNTQKQCFPACFVELPPNTEGRRAAFYLAAEEYVAKELPEGNYLFTWQLRPTVVMGRNQVAHQEIDIDFCNREGIDIIRRKSGGGAIFADNNNIMVSLVTGPGEVETLFAEYASCVSEGLNSLGAQTEVSGRNDIILRGGGKICGNAFYHLPQRNIVHGTMLYDTDHRLMQGALHPNVEKLKSAGVKSVRSRVALLKDFLPFGVDRLRKELRNILTDRFIALNDSDVEKIEAIEAGYYTPQYLYGSSAHADMTRSKRINGCGTVELHMALKGSIITDLRIQGDYFELQNAEETFKEAFIGKNFTKESLQAAIEQHHPERAIRNLNEAQLLDLLEGNGTTETA